MANTTLSFQTQWSLLWKLCNQAQHGKDDDPQEKQARAREHLMSELQEISRLSPYLPPTYQEAINIQQQRTTSTSSHQQPTSTLKDWISVFGPLYRKVAATTIRASRQGLQSITKFFSPIPTTAPSAPDRTPDKYPP